MPTICEIGFENNPLKVVYSGQVLRGNVHLSLTGSKTVRGVFIKIRGEGYCHWSTGSGKSRKTYTGKEDYLDERTYFMGGREGEVNLTPGSYNFTFQCALPPELPTSFEGGYGHIRYTACVVLDIPMWPDKEFAVAFTIIKPIDLNLDPVLRVPVFGKKHKTFYPCFLLCCCESEPLDITARAPVGGYTPGQTINLQIEAKNRSDQSVSDFTVQLVKQIVYHTHANSSRSKHETIVVAEVETEGCDLSNEVNLRANIVVPSISPTDNTTSGIIKVAYSIRVIGSVTGCHSNPTIYFPIIIGSIPIFDNPPAGEMNYMPTAPMPSNGVILQQPTAPLLDNGGNPSNGLYSNQPSPAYPSGGKSKIQLQRFELNLTVKMYSFSEPPTYEEATQFGNKENVFKPKYPMFRRQTSYSN